MLYYYIYSHLIGLFLFFFLTHLTAHVSDAGPRAQRCRVAGGGGVLSLMSPPLHRRSSLTPFTSYLLRLVK